MMTFLKFFFVDGGLRRHDRGRGGGQSLPNAKVYAVMREY
jgi:hypothetical protein